MDPYSLMASFSRRLELVRCFVPGRPISQGSKTLYGPPGKQYMAESNAAQLMKWRRWVNLQCMKSYADHLKDENVNQSIAAVKVRLGYHLHVDFQFHEPLKPPTHYPLFLSDPDLDKLLRAVGDALTTLPKKKQVGVWADDAAVCGISGTKRYATEEGAHVTVWMVTP